MSLDRLPVELLYDIQLYALSDVLPCVSRRYAQLFRSTSTQYKAQYLLGRILLSSKGSKCPQVITKALQYPLCTKEVLEAILDHNLCPSQSSGVKLPKRLFKDLAPRQLGKSGLCHEYETNDHPLPLLRYLYETERFQSPDPNASDGYALTKAVHANFIPLIKFLLYQGASPNHKQCLPIRIAIRKKNKALVRTLVERDDFDAEFRRKASSKKRRREDRVVITTELLKEAVRADARDIVEYFMLEKGVAPDMSTLRLMDMSGYT